MSTLGQVSSSRNATVVWAGIVAAGWAPSLWPRRLRHPLTRAGPEEVVVTGQREHYRGDVPVEELPQAVQVISGETAAGSWRGPPQ